MIKLIVSSVATMLFFQLQAQNVGIGTGSPTARLHVADSSVVFSANGIVPAVQGNPPLSGSGRRMMWYADKAAFRSGYADGNYWDKANIGAYSLAAGYGTQAGGLASVALGWATNAGGDYSFAAGNTSSAPGENATALGYGSIASGYGSIASGFFANASGSNATALGSFTSGGGTSATAMGQSSSANGNYATAIGRSVTASGHNSTAMGNYVTTGVYNGAFAIGDNSTTTVMQSFVDNGFRSRFAGGYRLLTNAAASIGVVLLPDGNSWGVASDVRLKENFLPINGEQLLQKIAALPLTTWNYIAQQDKTSRHYGPMAQDFFAAFGKDELGTIGSDTLINQQDFLGVNLMAIQALEKRTAELQKENEELKARLEKVERMMREKL